MLVVLVGAVALAGVLGPSDAGAGEGQAYIPEPRYAPYRDYRYYLYDQPSVTQSPDLLLPGFFPPWAVGCFQNRVVRTPVGWVRERIWVCS